ncbi:MAG: hypothetical protein CMA34_07835 [Euryarchaeota archaeon]|nr:hypothetical protein [Euryarchaeota archaeon]
MIRNYLYTIIGALCFAYGVFCIVKGGSHVKNVGWRTKEEYPKSFYFNVIFMILLGVSMFVSGFILKR